MTPILETRGLGKDFPLRGHRGSHIVAVDSVDLAIAPGEALGLVGESGCGKSTLARMICRLIEPTRGAIFLDGTSIGDIPPGAFARAKQRRDIQMVFQDPTESLNPRFSAHAAIADPLRQLCRGAPIASRVAEAAALVGLTPDLMTRYPHQLSGGQKARVGIARAMVVQPRLLVLDEPTSALDVSIQATILKLLVRLRREQGVAQLFVSHDLSVVRLICDRIAVMQDGRIVEEGPAETLFRAPRHFYTQALLAASPRLPVLK